MGYAKHVGRVGALAVALGIGAAVAATPGVAWADENPPAQEDNAGATADTPDTSTEKQDPGEVIRRNVERAADDLRDGLRTAITGAVQSSGGAITSTLRTGSGASSGNVPTGTPDVQKDEPQQKPFVANDNDTPMRSFTPRWRSPQGQDDTKPAAEVLDGVRDVVQQSITTLTGSQPRTGSTTVGRDAISTFAAAATEDQQDVRSPFVAPINIVTNVLNAALAPFINTTPGQPTPQNPVLWAVLGWVRRQFQDTPFGKVVLNRTPEITTAEVVDNHDGTFTITPSDDDFDPDGDSLVYTASDGTDGTVVENDDGTFTYTVTEPSDWDKADTITLTASDAAAYPHVHGLAGLFSPDGGHSASVTVAIAPDDGSLPPPPDVVKAPTELPDQPGVFETVLQYDPERVKNVSAAPGFEPKYWKVVSEDYDPETGQYTAHLVPTQAGQLRAALGLATTDDLKLQVIDQPTAQTFALRSASFAAAEAEDPPDQALTLPPPPAGHFEVDDAAIPVGSKPADVVVTDKYVYVLNTKIDASNPSQLSQPSTVTVIGADPTNAVEYNHVVTDIPVGANPIFAGLVDDKLYVVNSNAVGSTSSITIIDTNTNKIADAYENDGENDIDSISLPRGAFNPLISPDKKSIYLLSQDGNVYVIDTDPTHTDTDPATTDTYNTVVDEIPVGTGQTQNPDGSFAINFPISGGFSADGSRLYLVRDTQTFTPSGSTYAGDLVTINTENNTVVGDPVDLGQYGGYAASDGRYLFVPTLDTSNLDVTDPNAPAPPGYVTVVDIHSDPDNPTVVDQDTNTQELDRIPVGTLPINVAYSPDRSLAYVVNSGDGTVTVIDTANNEVLDLDPAPGVQGIVFDPTPSGALSNVNVIGSSPSGNYLYISNFSDNSVTALSFVEDAI